MEKKTSKKINTKAKKGVKNMKEKTSITLDKINLDNISTTGVVSIPTKISTITYNNAIGTDIVQNKIEQLKEQKKKATGTLKIYSVQDAYNFQIQVLEELLKEVK